MNDAKENAMENIDTTIVMESDQNLLLSGVRELSRGNEGAALETFTRALAGMGDSTLEALCSARLLLLRREMPQATRVLESLRSREPSCAEASFLLGEAYRETGRLFDAVQSFRMAVALDASDRRAAQALTEILDVQEP
jgi:cytochrome c-type biogenesis protein CcmH/NrfG